MLLIATGMHRSGTSAVTGLLSSLGAQLGTTSTLMPAHSSNARGHYEQLPIVEINDEILLTLGGHWLAPPVCAVSEFRRLARTELGARASAALTQCGWNPADAGSPFIVKDPRFCITLPFWRELLNDGFEVIAVYRHPREVAASLRARDGVADAYGTWLWANYNLYLLRGCEGLRALGVSYTEVLQDSEQLAIRLSSTYGLHNALSTSAIEPALRSQLSAEPIPNEARQMWAALQELEGREAPSPASLPDVGASIEPSSSAVRAVADEHRRAQRLWTDSNTDRDATIAALTSEIDRIGQQRDALQLQAQELSAQNDDLIAEIQEIRQQKHQSEEHLRAYLYSRAATPTRLFWSLKQRVTRQLSPSQRFTLHGANPERMTAHTVAIPSSPSPPIAVRASKNPVVSIVVPVHGELAFTSACLQSIVNSPDLTPYEIIVVDDASPDNTAEWLAECENVRVVHMETNVGYLRATNAGVAAATGSYVCLLNNDVLVRRQWLRALLRPFNDRANTGAVGARLLYPDNTLQEAGGIIFSDGSGWNYGRSEDPSDPRFLTSRTVDFSSAACLMVRKDLWDQLEGFDERYCPAYYEDVDLAFRLRERGYTVRYQPDATVVHFEGQSHGTDETTGLKAYQTRNRQIFAERWSTELQTQPAPGSSPDLAAWRTARPHVLVIDHQVPTPDMDAGSLRMKLILTSLVDLGCRVTFIPANGHEHGSYGSALRQLGVELRASMSPNESSLTLDQSHIDAVILSRPDVATAVLHNVRTQLPNAKIIYDMVDFHTVRLRRQAELSGSTEHQVAADSYEAIERRLFETSDLVIAVTDEEAAAVKEMVPRAAVRRLGTIHPRNRGSAEFQSRRGVVFVGSWSHPPNRDAVEWITDEIAPALFDRAPEIKIHIVGSDIPTNSLEVPTNVEVHGWLPSLDSITNQVRVSIAPLRFGAGIKGKVADAIARGLPVVTTTIGAEGFGPVRSALTIADSADEFVDKLIELHTDAAQWNSISELGGDLLDEFLGPASARTAITEILRRTGVLI